MSRKTALFVLVAVTAIILGAQTLTNGYLSLVEVSAPGTPPSGLVFVYPKSDGLLYSKDDAGTETLVSGGTGGGGTCAFDLNIPFSIHNGSTAYPGPGVYWGTSTAASTSGNFKTINTGNAETITINSFVPDCWTSETLNLDLIVVFGSQTGTATVDVQTACVSDNQTISYNTAQTIGSITKGSYTSDYAAFFTISGLTMTGCAANEQFNVLLTTAIGTLSSDLRNIGVHIHNQ